MKRTRPKSPDSEAIAKLGGPAKVARLLGIDATKGAIQRVHNWTVRGIPAAVKLDRPDLFPRGDIPASGLPAVGAANSEASTG
ncbi:hypothetical protein R77567_01640 [Ralstonia sp. LMG 32965]|uniref:Uncharacterized protein n=1 Tax=Ralstonia flatus TaxID=3058601 RepID=A0AAD2F568_9RALS|nr:hypothetical protein [Ralstonia sp. LMG 32965]MBN6211454.1 hypothetical protein [Ralstonia pickettii]CAJ0862349.1 hypothetical protein R77567_01640 [Ralstonia sp. LMG 32965]